MTSPATSLAEASVPDETLPNAAGTDVDGWRGRLLAEADRLEQLAAGHRATVDAIDKTIEQALALVESSGGET